MQHTVETDHHVSKPHKTRLKQACTRIERTISDLQSLAKGMDSAILDWHAEIVSVGRCGKLRSTPMLEKHGFGLMQFKLDDGCSAHARLSYAHFWEREYALIQRLGQSISSLTDLILEVCGEPTPRWVHPIVEVWGEGQGIRMWLRESHYEGCKTIEAHATHPGQNRPLPPGGLLPAVLLACKARGIGTGPTWDVGSGSAPRLVQASDLPSAMAWFTALHNHNALYLFQGTSTVLD